MPAPEVTERNRPRLLVEPTPVGMIASCRCIALVIYNLSRKRRTILIVTQLLGTSDSSSDRNRDHCRLTVRPPDRRDGGHRKLPGWSCLRRIVATGRHKRPD